MIIKTALLSAFVIFSMGASCNKNKTDENSEVAKMDDSVPEPETPAEDSYDSSYSDDTEYPAENAEESATEQKYDYQEESSESSDDSSY